jgi:hypothetical protein
MSVGVLKCSSITLREDPEIYTLMPFIEKFVVEVERCSTIDCYLIKLATLVDSVKEHFPRERTRRVLEKIMKCDEVQDSMSPLANYSNVITEIITRDPRHASLRSYIDIITTTLQGIKPKYKQLEVTREPTYRIEEWEKSSKEPIVALRTQRENIGPMREQGVEKRVERKTSNFANLLKIIAVIIIASTIGVLAYYVKPPLFNSIQTTPTQAPMQVVSFNIQAVWINESDGIQCMVVKYNTNVSGLILELLDEGNSVVWGTQLEPGTGEAILRLPLEPYQTLTEPRLYTLRAIYQGRIVKNQIVSVNGANIELSIVNHFAFHYLYPNRTGTAVHMALKTRNTGDAPLFLCSSIYRCKPRLEAYMSSYPAGIAILELNEPIVVNPGGENLINVLIYIDGVFLNRTSELSITLRIGAIVKNITIKNVNWA